MQIVVLAVYLLGGESQYVDTEDIAVKANEVAPGRFTWRKYPDQINIENVRTFLSDAKKPKNGEYLIGSGKKGWFLTETGHKFARKHVRNLAGADLSRIRMTKEERRWLQRERTRMLSSKAYEKFTLKKADEITVQEAEAFFRLDDYVTGMARERKLTRALNTFADDPDLGLAVKFMARKVRNA